LVDGGEHRVIGAGGSELTTIALRRLKRDAVALHQRRNVPFAEGARREQLHQLGLAERTRPLGTRNAREHP
jgi:hypothetical protein